jgi:hypothetical protein
MKFRVTPLSGLYRRMRSAISSNVCQKPVRRLMWLGPATDVILAQTALDTLFGRCDADVTCVTPGPRVFDGFLLTHSFTPSATASAPSRPLR